MTSSGTSRPMAPLEYALTMTPPPGSEHEAGRLQVHRVVVDEGTGCGGDCPGVGAVTDGNRSPCSAIRSWVVASSLTDNAATRTSMLVRRSSDRWNARSWALQYGHHEPR